MNVVLRLLAVSFLLVFAACESIAVDTDWDERADFDRLSTWAWLPRPATATGNPRYPGDLLDKRVRPAIEEALTSKGYPLSAGGAPTFFVTYHAAVERKLDVLTIDDGYDGPGFYGGRWGSRRWGGSRTYVTEWDQGTLAIDVVDAGSRELLWRGVATAAVDDASAPAEREARIREAVQKVIAEFPPGAAE